MKTKTLLISAVCALTPSIASAQDAGHFYMREVLIPKRAVAVPQPLPPVTTPAPTPTPDPNPVQPEPSPLVCSDPVTTTVNVVIQKGANLTESQAKTVEQAYTFCQNYATSSGQAGTCGWTKSSGRVKYWWSSGGSGTGYKFNALITCK